ncbi:MAG TPA: DUF4142 domain-containing protein [Gemmatimonadales bacterium]|nr:DUF4142 domain-containing protein [Gemmatimonadales bacterium]
MRMHFIVATLLVAPWVTAAAQDTTRMRDSIPAQPNSYKQAPQDGFETLSDEMVLTRMHQTHQKEIKMGQLAQRNGSAKVKSYGARLVKEHSAADQKVTAVAKKLGISTTSAMWMTPTHTYRQPGDTTDRDTTSRQGYSHHQPGDSLHARQGADSAKQREKQEHADLMGRLGTLRGAAFDSVFANAMVEGHQSTIRMLEPAQNQTQSAEVRTLIGNTLPTVREHLRIAQSLTTSATTTSSSQQ